MQVFAVFFVLLALMIAVLAIFATGRATHTDRTGFRVLTGISPPNPFGHGLVGFVASISIVISNAATRALYQIQGGGSSVCQCLVRSLAICANSTTTTTRFGVMGISSA